MNVKGDATMDCPDGLYIESKVWTVAVVEIVLHNEEEALEPQFGWERLDTPMLSWNKNSPLMNVEG